MTCPRSVGRRRPAAWWVACSLGLLTVMVPAACERTAGSDPARAVTGTVTLVNRVRAHVRGMTCATCESAVRAALRRRLDNVAITIDQSRQTIDLEFEQVASAFSSASFRQALAEADGEVVSVAIEACGTIAAAEGRSWLTSGSARLLIEGSGPFVAGAEVCVTGELRDQERPPRLVLGTFAS
jgi:copper chaperone CopZ